MFWLNFIAVENILFIVVTLLTFQAPMFWLNAEAPLNMFSILVTLLTFQLPMARLKTEAPANIPYILVTVLTFQLSILASPLKFLAKANIPYISVTKERLGVSVALLTRFSQPVKALFIELQGLVPHCSMDFIFKRSPPLLKKIRGKSPLISTV